MRKILSPPLESTREANDVGVASRHPDSNRDASGRAILIGTFPGAAYFKRPSAEARSFFAALLPKKQRITVNDTAVTARLHEGGGGSVLWIVNPTRESKTISATHPEGRA